MFNFDFGKKSFLGVDIGASNIKIVELGLNSGKPFLLNYAWASIFESASGNRQVDSEFFKTALPGYLASIIKEADFKSKSAFVSLPSFSGLLTLISLPQIPKEDMEQAIRFEAHKYIPTSLDDVVLSWEIIGEDASTANQMAVKKQTSSEEKENVQVLLVAASKSEIKSYEEVVGKAGLALKGIEIENISMVNSLVGNDNGNFIIVDIGSRICNIIYVEKGIIKINRNLDAGGYDLTRTIAKSLGITEERAENMKLSGQDFFSVQSEIRFPAVEMITGELSRILSMLSKDGAVVVDAIILSGGTANLKGFREFVAEKTGLKTIIGDPFSRVGYDKKLEPVLDKIKTGFSVSVGLALRGINK
ncbi:MAG: type IV pilus assembly protein PilM [Candidatus Pacebacteria bacterium]|nr:type IV pilus assembly protein PilM [Candidatus Paceibacterota bacterium]